MRWSSLTARSSWLTLSICGGRAQWLGASSVAESLQGCRTGHPRMCIAFRSGRLTCWVNRTGLFRRPSACGCRHAVPERSLPDGGAEPSARGSRAAIVVPAKRPRHLVLDTAIRATSRISARRTRSAAQRVTACANSTLSQSPPRRLRALSAREAVSIMQSRCAGRLTIPNGICWWLRTRSAAGSVTADRRSGITSADEEILDQIRADGYAITHHPSTRCSSPSRTS